MTSETEKIYLADLVGDRILIAPADLPKEQVLGQLVKLICQTDERLNFQEILQQILVRETELSTTLDSGLSIPHARLEGPDKALAALAVLPQPLQEVNGSLIKAVFLFIAPVRSEFFQTHLRILSTAVEVLSPSFMDKLSACTTPQAVLQLLAQAGENGEMI